jgi:hypothetical protein
MTDLRRARTDLRTFSLAIGCPLAGAAAVAIRSALLGGSISDENGSNPGSDTPFGPENWGRWPFRGLMFTRMVWAAGSSSRPRRVSSAAHASAG